MGAGPGADAEPETEAVSSGGGTETRVLLTMKLDEDTTVDRAGQLVTVAAQLVMVSYSVL